MTKLHIPAIIALTMAIAPAVYAAEAGSTRSTSVNIAASSPQAVKARVAAAARSVCTTDGAEGVRHIDAACKKAAVARATSELAARTAKPEALAAR